MGFFSDNTKRTCLQGKMKREGRLPPRQSLTLKWPVRHYGSVPPFDPGTWDFCTSGLVGKPLRLTRQEFIAPPKTTVAADL